MTTIWAWLKLIPQLFSMIKKVFLVVVDTLEQMRVKQEAKKLDQAVEEAKGESHNTQDLEDMFGKRKRADDKRVQTGDADSRS